MKILPILFSCLMLCCLSCSKDRMNARVAMDCPLIVDAEILSEDELPCNYNQVFRFEGEIYTRCVCCLCNKFAPPISCDGVALCSGKERDCFVKFEEKAEYLFAVEQL